MPARARVVSVIHSFVVIVVMGAIVMLPGEPMAAQTVARSLPARGPASTTMAEPNDLLVHADSLARTRRYNEAITLLHQYRTLAPDSVQGVVALARTYAMAGRLAECVTAYALATQMRPADFELRIAHATALAWAGNYDEAVRAFAHTVGGPAAVERAGQRGLASVAGWRGDHAEALRRWEQLVGSDARDLEAWIGLSNTRRWSGDARGALVAAQRATALQPLNTDAQRALHVARDVLTPSSDPQILQIHDSDGNRSQVMTLSARVVTPWPGAVTVYASHRDAEFLAARSTAQTLRGVMTSSVGAGGRVALRAEVGATRLEGSRSSAEAAATRIEPIVALGGALRVSPRLTIGATASRRPFDEVALLIVNGITTNAVEANAEFRLRGASTLQADAGVTRFEGGAPNTRQHGTIKVAVAARRWLSVGGTLAHQRNSGTPRDGYFAPARYDLAEGFARLGHERETGVMAALEAGLGGQRIAFTPSSSVLTQATQRLTASLTWRPTPRLSVSALGDAGRMASPFTQAAGTYEYLTLGLRARIPLR